jgi:hypothetical protein
VRKGCAEAQERSLVMGRRVHRIHTIFYDYDGIIADIRRTGRGKHAAICVDARYEYRIDTVRP